MKACRGPGERSLLQVDRTTSILFYARRLTGQSQSNHIIIIYNNTNFFHAVNIDQRGKDWVYETLLLFGT